MKIRLMMYTGTQLTTKKDHKKKLAKSKNKKLVRLLIISNFSTFFKLLTQDASMNNKKKITLRDHRKTVNNKKNLGNQ